MAATSLRRSSTSLIAWFAVGLGLGVGACALWWALVANEAFPIPEETLVIPDGTADAIARGEPFAFAADQIVVPPGTRLTLVNHDSAEHSVGDTVVPPGATATLETSETGLFSCTIHPSGHFAVSHESRPPIPAATVIILGLGLTTAAAAWVVRGATSAV